MRRHSHVLIATPHVSDQVVASCGPEAHTHVDLVSTTPSTLRAADAFTKSFLV